MALARGEIELNQQTTQAFIHKFFNRYKKNPNKGKLLLMKILRDSQTTCEFKNALQNTIEPLIDILKIYREGENISEENKNALITQTELSLKYIVDFFCETQPLLDIQPNDCLSSYEL